MSSHRFHLEFMPPQKSTPFGSRTDVNQLDFPVLSEMSLSLLRLEVRGMREPHWHPNASELNYCVEGRGLITIFGPGSSHNTFLIEPGTLSFIPMGSLHYIENVGNTQLKMLLCFDNDNPEDLDLSSSLGAMPEGNLAETFKVDKAFFPGLHADINPIFITEKSHMSQQLNSWKTNSFKMDLGSIQAQVQTRGGTVKMSNNSLFPALNGLALYSLTLEKNGAREPHWHPNAHELNFLVSGTAKITLLSPGGNVESFDMKAGDISFLPKGYIHTIENTGNDAAQFAIFFNHAAPSDIGISGCLGAYPNEVLASIFKVPTAYFDKLPKFQSDLFVVSGGG